MHTFGFSDSLAAFADMMGQGKNFSDRWQSMTDWFATFGADQINYGVLENISFRRDEAPVTFISTMNPEWIAYYGERRLDLHDPHVTFVREGRLAPYRWSEDILPHLDTEAEQGVVKQTVDAGLRAQISVIAPDPLGVSGPVGGLTIGSSLHPHEFFGSVGKRDEMLVAAAAIFHHHAIGEVRRNQVGAQPLSIRERDCMVYAASGFRTARMAERMKVSEVTVEMHLRSARKKLRAQTTAQAIARAMIFGDVKI